MDTFQNTKTGVHIVRPDKGQDSDQEDEENCLLFNLTSKKTFGASNNQQGYKTPGES